MVRGAPYSGAESEREDVDAVFVEDLRQLMHDLGDARPVETPPDGEQITSRMKELREADLKTRQTVYRRDRLREQRDWTRRKRSGTANAPSGGCSQ